MSSEALWPRTRRLVAASVEDIRHPTTPFGRLAVTHIAMVAADTLVTVALAGSLFFSISPDAARGQVGLYLLLTIAPFVVVAPVLSPLLDRGRSARRGMVVASAGARAVLCVLMAGDTHSLLLFPEAFLILVASKAYTVTKSSLVPGTVGGSHELVSANSRLSLLSGLTSLVAGGIGSGLLAIPGVGSPWVLRLDALVLVGAGVAGTRLLPAGPSWAAAQDTPPAPGARRRWSMRASGSLYGGWAPLTLVAGSAMAVLRGGVGFLTFLLAFDLRREGASTLLYGAVLVAAATGNLVATLLAPRLRRFVGEDRILFASLVAVAAMAVGAAMAGAGNAAVAGLAGVMGLGAGCGKVSFDALVQRDAPELHQGRAFGRFETRFQLAWVLGGLVPVVAAIPMRSGAVVLAFAMAVAAASFAAARHALEAGRGPVAGPGQTDP
ncbi:MAG: MFS transporter [Acidimicrobiales bacterium]